MFAFMILSPVLSRISEKSEILVKSFSYTGYIWMGLMIIFTFSSFLIDFYRLVLHLLQSAASVDLSFIIPSTKLNFYIPFTLSLIVNIYGYFEARNIRLEKITIQSRKISPEADHMKIVQISDIHLGVMSDPDVVRSVVSRIKTENPDIVVSTGDLVDGQFDMVMPMSSIFSEISPKYGKFAVTGNHEYYAGLQKAIEFTGKSGFTLLQNEFARVGGSVVIAGLSDIQAKTYGIAGKISAKELLAAIPQENFIVLLQHRPVLDPDIRNMADLILCGHAHKGQIFPMSLMTRLIYVADSGLLSLGNNSYLYVSRGTGTWGPPIRFLAPPEITVIELRREE
jgi:predicted MPP superfamily phosphohydrolase